MAISATLATRPDPTVFAPLLRRLRAWRARRVRGERIPEELWDAAAALARVHGLSATATALKLSYYPLQERLLRARSGATGGSVPATFVELSADSTARPSCEASTLELVRTSGVKLTLRLPPTPPRDFLPLVELFLREGR